VSLTVGVSLTHCVSYTVGDHAYNLGMEGDKRGDAYMNAFQPALSQIPWFPMCALDLTVLTHSGIQSDG
jgi:hypothetical protein